MLDGILNAAKGKLVSLRNAVVILGIFEGQRDDTGIYEIGAVDSRKGFYYDGAYSEIERNEGCVLAGGALAVVFSADDKSAAELFASFGKFFVANSEAEIRKIGNV